MPRSPASPAPSDPIAAARSAGLRYVNDGDPGIARQRAGKEFRYHGPGNRRINDAATLGRIKRLAIPPAWTEVWICPQADGHIQATGRDARGRKQYRYHPDWRTTRDQTKYERIIAFGRALPRIRRQVARDLRRPELPREKVLAAMVRLLETTLIRVGNEEYARDNGSIGLSTMRDRHARIRQGTLYFDFRGKSGIRHHIEFHDPRIARIVRRVQELPGQELFQYVDNDGQTQDIKSDDVNAYLRGIAGDDFSAKDFRTWAGTVLAAIALRQLQPFTSKTEAKRNLVAAVERVAQRLGNTPAVCRKCYIHPAILDSYLDGRTVEAIINRAEDALSHDLASFTGAEGAVLGFLHAQLKRDRRQPGLLKTLQRSVAGQRRRASRSPRRRGTSDARAGAARSPSRRSRPSKRPRSQG